MKSYKVVGLVPPPETTEQLQSYLNDMLESGYEFVGIADGLYVFLRNKNEPDYAFRTIGTHEFDEGDK